MHQFNEATVPEVSYYFQLFVACRIGFSVPKSGRGQNRDARINFGNRNIFTMMSIISMTSPRVIFVIGFLNSIEKQIGQ